MNTRITSTVFLIVVLIASCQSKEKDDPAMSPASKDTLVNGNMKPTDSGYADVNGLKMYYEVYCLPAGRWQG